MTSKKVICRVCKSGEMHETLVVKDFFPNQEKISVELLGMACKDCGSIRVLCAQYEDNIRRLAARKSLYAGQLMTEDYVYFRKKYGLTQKALASMLGLGLLEYSQYEDEVCYPDVATLKRIQEIMTKPVGLIAVSDTVG